MEYECIVAYLSAISKANNSLIISCSYRVING